MVRIECVSNLDVFRRLGWPEMLPETPQVGDLIRSTSSIKQKYIELEVCRRTWYKSTLTGEWICQVELHLVRSRGFTIESFEKWVRS